MELETDTDSSYLPLSEKELYDWIRGESQAEWDLLRTEDCKDDFTANATNNFLPRTCCTKHIEHDKREPGLIKEEFRCTAMLCLCSQTIVVMTTIPTNTNSAAKVQTKER